MNFLVRPHTLTVILIGGLIVIGSIGTENNKQPSEARQEVIADELIKIMETAESSKDTTIQKEGVKFGVFTVRDSSRTLGIARSLRSPDKAVIAVKTSRFSGLWKAEIDSHTKLR